MKIETLHLVNSLSPNGITGRENTFEYNELGVLVTPKGSLRSFSKRVRFIPWANIKACDIAEEKPEQPAVDVPPSIAPVTSEEFEAGLRDPERNKQPPPDVIKFVKNEKTGVIEEKRIPHRSVEEPPETSKSAFAKLRDAKAEPAPE